MTAIKNMSGPPQGAPDHIGSLTNVGSLKSACGRQISVWQIDIKASDPLVSAWAKHFRQAYCADAQIDLLRLELTRKDYLKTMVFPHASQRPGPSIRSGDFAELLISDFLEYTGGYWVPRYKYQDKASPNESVKGSDVLGFQQVQPGTASVHDVLIVCEVKAQLTGKSYKKKLAEAIKHSSKDIGPLRLGTTLNALKRRALTRALPDKVALIERFQRKTDTQFVLKSSAAAVLTSSVYDAVSIANVDCTSHANAGNLELMIIKGDDLMQLAHKLYEVAASEA